MRIHTILAALLAAAQLCGQSPYWNGKYPRPEPLREIGTEASINAKDFGAKPDSAECSADAIQAALDELAKRGNAKLVIEKGVYRLKHSPKNGQRVFRVEGAKNIVIDARGSSFIIESPFLGLWTFVDCENVIIENMSLDYDPLPHTSGRIVSVDAENLSIVAETLPKHPRFDAEHLQSSKTGFFMDSEIRGRPKRGMANGYSATSFTHLGAGQNGGELFKISFGELPEISLLRPGDVFTRTCKRSAAAFGGYHLKNVTFRNLDVYASPAGGWTTGMSEGMNFISCNNLIGKGRWKSTNADAFHMPNNRVGPWIEDCRIEGIADDCANIYLVPTFPVERPDARTLRLVPKGSRTDKPLDEREFRVGDEVFFFNPQSNAIFFSAKVESADWRSGILKFDRDLPELSLGLDKRHATTVYNAENSKGIVVINSSFKNSKRFGLYIKGENILIENNYFEGLSSSAITLHNEPGWPEGLFSRNVVIRKNVFNDNGFEEHYELGWPGGSISSLAPGYRGAAPYYMNSNILIEDNEFRLWRGRAIYLRDTEEALIRNNRFYAPSAPSGIPGRNRPNDAAVCLEKSRAVTLENNVNNSGADELRKKNCAE